MTPRLNKLIAENWLYCYGCIYRKDIGTQTVCDYVNMANEVRGCPAGDGCTRKRVEE